jgi:hypothetical protein
MSYYYPDTPVLYLPAHEQGNRIVAPFWALAGKEASQLGAVGRLPGGTNIAWSVTSKAGLRGSFASLAGVSEIGPLIVLRAANGQRFSAAGHQFAVADGQ